MPTFLDGRQHNQPVTRSRDGFTAQYTGDAPMLVRVQGEKMNELTEKVEFDAVVLFLRPNGWPVEQSEKIYYKGDLVGGGDYYTTKEGLAALVAANRAHAWRGEPPAQ